MSDYGSLFDARQYIDAATGPDITVPYKIQPDSAVENNLGRYSLNNQNSEQKGSKVPPPPKSAANNNVSDKVAAAPVRVPVPAPSPPAPEVPRYLSSYDEGSYSVSDKDWAVTEPCATAYYGTGSKLQGFNTVVSFVDIYGNARALPTADGNDEVVALRLGMSPDTLSIDSSKVINRYQTMTRWVEEHWGDECDSLSFSGSSFGFVTSDGYMLTAERRTSAAYQELRHFIDMCKANGLEVQEAMDGMGYRSIREFYIATSPKPVRRLVEHPRAGMLKRRFYVRLTFDFASFLGYFDTFSVIDDAGSPYLSKYEVSFKVEKTEWK